MPRTSMRGARSEGTPAGRPRRRASPQTDRRAGLRRRSRSSIPLSSLRGQGRRRLPRMMGIDWPPTRTTFGFPSSISTLTSMRLAWGDLEGWDARRHDLGNESLRAEVVRSDPEGRCERSEILDLRPERRLALGHDDFLHLPAFADQFERQHADFEFLVDDG